MTNALLWRPIPILTLTVRQFLGGRALWVVGVLSFVPCLFAGIYLLDTGMTTRREFLAEFVLLGLVSPTLLPIATLILATGALGNEIEDRTMPYLVLKPLTRLRIVLEKYLGILVVAVPTVVAGLLTTFLLVALFADDPRIIIGRSALSERDLAPVLWAMVVAATVGVVATAAFFLLVSLVIPRALLAGIVYAFAWESLLGRFLPGIKVVSIRHYTDSVFTALLDDPNVTVDSALSLTTALVTVACLVVLSLVLATLRLRTMNLE